MVDMKNPSLPKNIDPYSQACIQALENSEYGKFISLGGAFALSHYYQYRTTKYIDAWWGKEATAIIQEKIILIVKSTLSNFGGVEIQKWGDVVSIELIIDRIKVFSFQIAIRSGLINQPLTSPYKTILLDSLEDLIAAKMSALVARGAPRDFNDIHHLCIFAKVHIQTCWELWEKRNQLSKEKTPRIRAIIAIRSHLSRLEGN
jgi:hypothetical protein